MSIGQQASIVEFQSPIDWLSPDETLYSLASRFHSSSGNSKALLTSQQLFGQKRGGFPYDLPTGIAHFAKVFDGALGTSRQILIQRTPAPQLLVARSHEVREEAFALLEAGPIGSLKSQLGLLASGFGASLPLKACPRCVAADVREIGTGYWRIEHQLTGVWICRHHRALLEVSALMRSGQGRYDWLVPHASDLRSPIGGYAEPNEAMMAVLDKYADASRGLFDQGQGAGLDAEKVSKLLRQRLIEEELADPSGRLRQVRVSEEFSRFSSSVRAIPELSGIAAILFDEFHERSLDADLGLALARDAQNWLAVTLGPRGVLFMEDGGIAHLPAFPIEAVDTLGAGDVWHGAFALALAEGQGEREAVRFASAVAAIKCTRFGGRAGTPTRDEVERFLAANP